MPYKKLLHGLAAAAAGALLFAGCNVFHSPTSPSGNGTSGLPGWHPCVIVQNPGFRSSPEFIQQMDAVRRLHAAGAMNWIRLGGLNVHGDGKDYAVEAKSMGLNVFGIVTQQDLESVGWERAFDQMVRMYPEVDMWEIAGEITNTSVNAGPLTPEYYIPKFRSLVEYAKSNYPNLRLVSAPTEGNASGPTQFQRFMELGLANIDAVIAVNIYTDNALQEYASVFDRHASELASRRIWVTESGSGFLGGENQQIGWVEREYQQINNTVRPEMICWYVMWAGNVGGDSDFSLLKNLTASGYTTTPLFKKLTGEAQ